MQRLLRTMPSRGRQRVLTRLHNNLSRGGPLVRGRTGTTSLAAASSRRIGGGGSGSVSCRSHAMRRTGLPSPNLAKAHHRTWNGGGIVRRSYHRGRAPAAAAPSSSLSSSSSPGLILVLGVPAAALCVDPTLPSRGASALDSLRRSTAAARCEAPAAAAAAAPGRRRRGGRRRRASRTEVAARNDSRRWARSLRRRAARALRALIRAAQLLLALGPAAALYPAGRLLSRSDGDGDGAAGGRRRLPDWYLDLCLRLAERSGAAVVKLLQWASSRPDLFGEPFCAAFERLQDRTTPHGLGHTEEVLREAYGEDWESRIRLGEVIGSGCIGQVYKGTVESDDGKEQDVAIKVMHPNIRGNIDADLDLLRFLAALAERLPFGVGSRLKWLDLPGTVEEFASLLTLQLDFRTEAENLRRFNKNFADDDRVVFPELVDGYDARRDVLIETYCDGTPVLSFLRDYRPGSDVRTELCRLGIRTVCRMIFDHNFIHGDLHPGNIFVCPDTRRFILLDAGMVTEYDDADHERIVKILTSFIRMDGRRAGELMISDSKARTSDGGGAAAAAAAGDGGEFRKAGGAAAGQAADVGGGDGDDDDDGLGTSAILGEEAYVDKIEALTLRAAGPDYFMEHLGTYITYFCEAASTHHVMMNPAFVSAALAVKVQEGVALALDPTVEIWRIANPIILRSEFRRNLRKVRDRVFGALLGLVPRSEDWEHAQDLITLSGLDM